MTVSARHHRILPSAALALALGCVLVSGLAGCANIGDGMTTAFADPAKYELYDCKQLEAERKNIATRLADLQGLMAKAQTGVAGPVVAELAYRNEYIAVRGQSRFAEDAWQRNKCIASPMSVAAPPPPVKPDIPAPADKGARTPKR